MTNTPWKQSKPKWQVYRGHEIEHDGGEWIIKRNGVRVHVEKAEHHAKQWIDEKRDREMANDRARRHK